jgi:hypothetical protein
MNEYAVSRGMSQAAGPTDPPLLEETIGANLSRTVAAHFDREALVEGCQQPSLDVERAGA